MICHSMSNLMSVLKKGKKIKNLEYQTLNCEIAHFWSLNDRAFVYGDTAQSYSEWADLIFFQTLKLL